MFWDLCKPSKFYIFLKMMDLLQDIWLNGDLLTILGGKRHPRQISCSWAPLPYNTRGNGKSSDKWKHWKHYSCNHCKQILLFVTDSLSLRPSCIFVVTKNIINHEFTSYWHFMISGDWNAKWLQRGPYFVSTVSRNNFNEWITSMAEHFWRGKKSALASIQLRVRKNSTAWHQDDWNLT